jgi:hypothetical protein
VFPSSLLDIRLVNHVLAGGAANGPQTTSGIDTRGAKLLVAFIAEYSGASSYSFSDNKGNTWAQLTARNTGSGSILRTYYCLTPIVGSGHTFTVGGSSIYSTIGIMAFAFSHGMFFDVESGATFGAGSGSSLSSGSITPTLNNELVIYGTTIDASGADVTGVSFSSILDHSGNIPATSFGLGQGYEVQTTATSRAQTWTYSASTGAALEIAAFSQQWFAPSSANPVLTKGGSYGGWTADALAAPSVCYDGTQYVMTVSLWSIANSQWASAFFTSPDLSTWTYVSGSLWAPSGGDYIVGNAGLAWFGGKYWFAYGHYPSSAGNIGLAYSTDLISWTVVNSTLLTTGADANLCVNPTTGLLELWYIITSSRDIHMTSSPDGTTWTDQGDFLSPTSECSSNFGEPSVFYLGTTRYLLHDCATNTGFRHIALRHSVNQDTTWVYDGIAFTIQSAAWEAGQVFDGCVILSDTKDGNGNIPRLLYAGSDTHSSTDNTDSSIGLAYMPLMAARQVSVNQAVNRAGTY